MYNTRIYNSDCYACVCMYICVSVCTCLCMHVIMRILETSTTGTELSAHTAHANITASAYIYTCDTSIHAVCVQGHRSSYIYTHKRQEKRATSGRK